MFSLVKLIKSYEHMEIQRPGSLRTTDQDNSWTGVRDNMAKLLVLKREGKIRAQVPDQEGRWLGRQAQEISHLLQVSLPGLPNCVRFFCLDTYDAMVIPAPIGCPVSADASSRFRVLKTRAELLCSPDL